MFDFILMVIDAQGNCFGLVVLCMRHLVAPCKDRALMKTHLLDKYSHLDADGVNSSLYHV